jgi:A/G-specific adenine glycosylase
MTDFAFKLITWYEENKRDLPWRNTQDPYFIWLSEIILQQTRVAQGMPYYLRFAEAFPTIKSMAEAQEQEILRLWQGLGYYSRARNMHQSAKMVMQDFGGIFPESYAKILTLKGVGNYTAAAIASFAFNENVAVVDGNVFRVLARIFGVEEDIASGKGQKVFQQLANELLPQGKSATYNQAIMEFGATFCKPVAPDCNSCIFNDKCIAFAQKRQQELPLKIKKLKIKERNFTYLVFSYEDKLMMKMRGAGDIWQGLYDFPIFEYILDNEEVRIEKSLKNALAQLLEQRDLLPMKIGQRVAGNALTMQKVSQTYKHLLTHQKITAQFVHFQINNIDLATQLLAELGVQFYNLEAIQELPKPILIANYMEEC